MLIFPDNFLPFFCPGLSEIVAAWPLSLVQ